MKQIKENLEKSILEASRSVQPGQDLLARILSERKESRRPVTEETAGRLFNQDWQWSFLNPKIFLSALALVTLFLVFGRISPENGFDIYVFEAETGEISSDIDELAEIVDEEAVLAEIDLFLTE